MAGLAGEGEGIGVGRHAEGRLGHRSRHGVAAPGPVGAAEHVPRREEITAIADLVRAEALLPRWLGEDPDDLAEPMVVAAVVVGEPDVAVGGLREEVSGKVLDTRRGDGRVISCVLPVEGEDLRAIGVLRVDVEEVVEGREAAG